MTATSLLLYCRWAVQSHQQVLRFTPSNVFPDRMPVNAELTFTGRLIDKANKSALKITLPNKGTAVKDQ